MNADALLDAPGAAVESTPPLGLMDPSSLEVGAVIGQGGMATIHLATLRGAGPDGSRQVALKLMHAHLGQDPSVVQRFEHEVRSQVELKHPNVVEMIGWGREGAGRLFMVMELMDGPSLRDLFASGRRFPADIAAHVVREVLRGLQAAHARGLVHRDVKPGNVMLTKDGRVKVADFGIAKTADMTKLTATGSVIGTPAYMSPEQALARAVDPRSDLFSAGVMLYEMLLGGNPFLTDNPATTLARIVHQQQRPAFESLPQTPAALDELVEGLLQKDPEKRIKDAAQALALLDRCIEEEDLRSSQAVMAEFMQDPDGVTAKLNARRASRHFERGRTLHAAGRGTGEAALWEFFIATLLDPSHAQARTWLEQVSKERGFSLQNKTHPRLQELEQKLRENPDDLRVVLQLAKMHKAQGNFLQVVYYWKRARALRPSDTYSRQQLDTLVSAQAAVLIDATGIIEVENHVPARVRPKAEPVPQVIRAEGWGDFLGSLWAQWWAKLAVGVAVLVGLVLLMGNLIEGAKRTVDARANGSPAAGDPIVAAHGAALDEIAKLMTDGRQVTAETKLRVFLENNPSSPLASRARFMLGQALDEQGDRDQAFDVHGDNAKRSGDDWGLRSLLARGEILLVRGDLVGAQAEFDHAKSASAGEMHARAMLALAKLAWREGLQQKARDEFEELLQVARKTVVMDEARRTYIEFLHEIGDNERAAQLEEQAKTDKVAESYEHAADSLDRLGVIVESPAIGRGSKGLRGAANQQRDASDAQQDAGDADGASAPP
jgi:serine/threonine-protein kinase